MMDGSPSQILDQAICGSCKHLFAEKDKVIDDLKRNLQTHENRVQNLENEVKKFKEQIANVVAGIYLYILHHDILYHYIYTLYTRNFSFFMKRRNY
jgi:hypothetical protein